MSKPVSVRYIVNDVDAAIEFYTKMLDFKVKMHPGAEFAILSRGNLRRRWSRNVRWNNSNLGRLEQI